MEPAKENGFGENKKKAWFADFLVAKDNNS